MGKFKENVEKGSFSRSVCNKLDEMIANIGGGNTCIYVSLSSRLFSSYYFESIHLLIATSNAFIINRRSFVL